jgi:E3 ubiquitin-protein ligase HUWE1
MRADVVEQHLREQNRLTQPAAADDATMSSLDAEFLAALPPDLRAEVIMQESREQARRQREESSHNALNQHLTGPSIGQLASGLANELNEILRGDTGMGMPDLLRPIGRALPPFPGAASGGIPRSAPPLARPKRDAIQLLEKPGVASLVRLLFFPQAIRKTYLFRTLVHLCENTKTRVDLLNLLLSIVQDGSGDLPAVDRSFQQMSLKALSTPKQPTTTPKGKPAETPAAPLISGLFTQIQSDHIPTFIAQRCFEALSFIVGGNQQAVTYFLTEHEQPVGLRKIPSKKGKGKEKYLPQTKFPIVILIGLLDRPVLLKTPGMMESLTGLLAAVTKPLANLPTKEKVEEEKAAAASAKAPEGAAPGTAVESAGAPAAEDADAVAAASTTATAPASTKQTQLKAPIIPPAVLRLVINGLTIGDCTARTFSQTLSVLQNLSYIPDAKAILVHELITRSQALGSVIQDELKELAAALSVKEGELSPAAIEKFSPASSSQAQLLRLLKTIDYLHSRKTSDSRKDGLLTKDEEEACEIYKSFDFGHMWKQLSDCLTLAEERDSTDQIAAVLLPLVESLMVVCRFNQVSSATDSSKSPLSPVLSPVTTTPPPTDLFISFTTTHRKVLNAIVRNSPILMNGSFSLLIANPKVLEFDNKRNWFFLKLKRKRDALQYVSLPMNVRRQYVFQDSYSALLHRSGDEIKHGKINVKFINEDGIDAGGVTREWYHVLAQQIFDPNFALFEPCAADKQTYQPNKHSSVVDDHLSFFKFVGRVIGKAIYDGRLLDAYFSRAFYKQILGRSVDMRDLESIDPEFHKSLQWMLDNDITDIIDQEFTIEDDSFGEKKIAELKPGGAKVAVTEENKAEYVRLVCAYRLENSIKEQMNAFLTGFYEIIPRHLIQIFEPDQLECK